MVEKRAHSTYVKAKENIASNYWPISCFPLVWMLLTVELADGIYDYLEEKLLLPEEQKGCRRNCKGTSDLSFIDKMILQEVPTRKKNLVVHELILRKHMIWLLTRG